jgi:hypothetical protein
MVGEEWLSSSATTFTFSPLASMRLAEVWRVSWGRIHRNPAWSTKVSKRVLKLDVSRQYVDRLSREDPKFPKPEVELASGRVWSREAIEKWAKPAGRQVAK